MNQITNKNKSKKIEAEHNNRVKIWSTLVCWHCVTLTSKYSKGPFYSNLSIDHSQMPQEFCYPVQKLQKANMKIWILLSFFFRHT